MTPIFIYDKDVLKHDLSLKFVVKRKKPAVAKCYFSDILTEKFQEYLYISSMWVISIPEGTQHKSSSYVTFFSIGLM